MSEELFPYYEPSSLFIRQLTQEFTRRYPGPASRLQLEGHPHADPLVERLLESFALVAGRVHHKLDDEFPELTDALLQVLYPHYLAPVPSLAIVQFELDPHRGQFEDGFHIDRHSRLITSYVDGLPCRYRTTYPVTLWPIQLTEARFRTAPFPAGVAAPAGAAAALILTLECPGQERFAGMSLESLRLFLSGANEIGATLFEYLFYHALQVVFRAPEGQVALAAQKSALTPVGFDKDESLLPYPEHAFLGYRLLTEFFAFPSKFLFVDLGGWQQVRRAGFQDRCEVVIFFDRSAKNLQQEVDASTLRLGCTPVVNLFEQVAEPITLMQGRYEYPIVPDLAHPQGIEVYSVDGVTSTDPTTNRVTDYQPFYSFRHGSPDEERQPFWYTSRRPSLQENDRGSDVHLHLVDRGFEPHLPDQPILEVRATCTNRGLPAQLQVSGELAFDLEASAPLAALRCLRVPTAPVRPRSRRGGYWRLLSHLNLNYLSLSDPIEGSNAFRELLRLYDLSDPEAGQQQQADMIREMIDGITQVSSRRVLGRLPEDPASGFSRGIEVTLEFDEKKYEASGLYLFASVLERFLSLYVTVNSFAQLVARSHATSAIIKKWPPRAGVQELL